MAPTPTFLNTAGNPVSWEELDEAEQAFHTVPPPWVVTEYGMTLVEYVVKWHADAALHETYFDDDSLIPD